MKILLFFILVFPSQISARNIIITEIFADPTPSKGLPEVEFIEIHNPNDFPVTLKNYKLQYATTLVNLPETILEPLEYAIICRNSQKNTMEPFGKTIGVSNLSLNNTAATLRILDGNNFEVAYVSYSNTWYAPQKNQGYSLELIDLELYCLGQTNWTSSKNELGATPGKENSVKGILNVFPDLKVVFSDFTSEEIRIVFNRPLSILTTLDHFESLENIEIISFDFSDNQRHEIRLKTLKHSEKKIHLNLYEIQDCLGNIHPELSITLSQYAWPQKNEIQISEILFNPKSGGQDFVELHNTSSTDFNLKNWFFANRNSSGQISSLRKISENDLVLPAQQFIAFTTDTTFLQENYPFTGNLIQIPSMPSYPNENGSVLILSPDSTLFEEKNYTAKMHTSLLYNPDGVSLEKTSFTKDKWASASSDVGYATPGLPNSQQENENLKIDFYTEPVVFNPHQGPELVTHLNYELQESGSYASIIIYNTQGRKVKVLGNNLLLGTNGKFSWDGRDQYGNLLPVGYYVFSIKVFSASDYKTYFSKAVIASN